MPAERLQKVLAAAGVASRRASEGLIAAGRITVDGRTARIGDQVDPATARIELDGVPIGGAASHAYLALHKPAGVTSTTADRHAATTVLDLLPTALVPDGARLYPVGRLDLESEGLILLTNDGGWSERVLHPRYGVEREYAIGLASALDAAQRAVLDAGVELEEGLAAAAFPLRAATGVETARLAAVIRPLPDPALVWYRATLRQGWKRQLRRMFAAVGVPIVRLVRVRIGIVRLDDLQSGRTRRLRAPEIRALGAGHERERGAAGHSGPPSRRPRTARRPEARTQDRAGRRKGA